MNRPEYLRSCGITNPIPRPISRIPVNKTQNVGSPNNSGTIGSNHDVSVKCAIPTFTKNIPRMVAQVYLARVAKVNQSPPSVANFLTSQGAPDSLQRVIVPINYTFF